MNRTQKIALSLVITISAGFILGCIAGLGYIGIAGLGGFSPLIFRKDKGKVTVDERDKLIKRRSALAGLAASYLFVGLACMIPFSILGPKASISVTWLPNIFAGTALSAFFVTSVAILVQYGWRNEGEKS